MVVVIKSLVLTFPLIFIFFLHLQNKRLSLSTKKKISLTWNRISFFINRNHKNLLCLQNDKKKPDFFPILITTTEKKKQYKKKSSFSLLCTESKGSQSTTSYLYVVNLYANFVSFVVNAFYIKKKSWKIKRSMLNRSTGSSSIFFFSKIKPGNDDFFTLKNRLH